MQKQSAMHIPVKRMEGAWDAPRRIASVPPPGNTGEPAKLWAWNRVLDGARRQLDHYISLEPKVLKGRDPEAIHDIRVASRQLQQVLDLIYPPPGPSKVQKIRRRIRRSRRALSEVRNCDVLLERARRILARKRASRRDVWSAFQDYVEERREQSFRKASRRLSKLNLPGVCLRLQESLALPIALAGQEESSGEEANLQPRLAKSLQETWSAFEGCVKQAREMPDAASLHTVRIAAKKVRYLIEVIHTLEVTGSGDAVASLRRLQRHLGDWHDLEVLGEMMLEMVAQPRFLTERLELAVDVERLVLRNRKSMSAYVEQFLHMTSGSEEWLGLEGWVREYLASNDISAQAEAEESQSPALAPSPD